jgi:putative membrane protein
MYKARPDSVSNIHRRWSFIRLNPASSKVSYTISILAGTVIIFLDQTHLHKINLINLLSALLTGVAALTISDFLDFLVLRGTPVNKISKVLHVSAFANLLWMLTVLLGIVFALLFSRQGVSLDYYIVEGMFFASGLRIGIFTSVFGSGLLRAVAISFLQPLIVLFAFEHSLLFYNNIIRNPIAVGFGLTLVMLAVLWTIIADRAGRPVLMSTFAVLQAFLAAWTDNDPHQMERISESKAHDKAVKTYIIKFGGAGSKETYIILPDVHPGPFNPIGGSNLPYVLYDFFSKNAIIMHSVSDHSLNIPSKIELDRYMQSLSNRSILEFGDTCTLPVQVRIGDSLATGVAFGRTAIIILSMDPSGMEDVSDSMRRDIERHSSHIGLKHVLVVDGHNAMGQPLREGDSKILLKAAKQCLEKLNTAEQYNFKVGFANSDYLGHNKTHMSDLGQAGLASILLEIKGNQYFIGWADSNNMVKEFRNYIISALNKAGRDMIEVCTSDTHSTSGKRTTNGYYALGKISKAEQVARIYLELSRRAIMNESHSRFEVLLVQSTIKLMGKDQFEHYSFALDKSMTVTKLFIGITSLIFIIMLFLT